MFAAKALDQSCGLRMLVNERLDHEGLGRRPLGLVATMPAALLRLPFDGLAGLRVAFAGALTMLVHGAMHGTKTSPGSPRRTWHAVCSGTAMEVTCSFVG